jgi:hypothetical protein
VRHYGRYCSNGLVTFGLVRWQARLMIGTRMWVRMGVIMSMAMCVRTARRLMIYSRAVTVRHVAAHMRMPQGRRHSGNQYASTQQQPHRHRQGNRHRVSFLLRTPGQVNSTLPASRVYREIG